MEKICNSSYPAAGGRSTAEAPTAAEPKCFHRERWTCGILRWEAIDGGNKPPELRLRTIDVQVGFSKMISILLGASLPFSSLYPFIYFTIRDFNLASQEEDIGYYAGFVVCREEYQALALSTISSSRGIGIIIGPAIGGFFAQVSILFQAFDLSFVKTGEERKKCQCYKKISILIHQHENMDFNIPKED
ncbi:hypothetical protein L2E82_35794 [Cichorium intybus]|uniref:Uncharacterized protein n=1 Tax=Cichorium intybus TaxID=13427 RepID=A0ACB9BPX3_CICIN|nr:hypothetical protein L2E82_35794 [Cichorium intybus]